MNIGPEDTVDPDSNEARLAAHRRLHNIGLPPHPDIVRSKSLQREASFLVAQAIGEIDVIVDTNFTGYADFGDNPRRNHTDKRPFTLKDARPHARYAAKLLREAWEMLDPCMSSPQRIHDDHALRTRLINLGWTPPATQVIVAKAMRSGNYMALMLFQRKEAISHLQAILNIRRTATQALESDRAAREWLCSIGSDPT
jgi:hypothetical protein